jgi:uroporphyrinogen-III synthase
VRAGEVDIITFTSASTVRHFSTVVGSPAELTRVPTVVCIGPSTAAAAEEAGLVVTAVAEPHNTDGLVAAVAATAADGGTM